MDGQSCRSILSQILLDNFRLPFIRVSFFKEGKEVVQKE